ncbi:MAG: 4'-phosphopantetheinyl transferase superfamily protein [Clostridia bacterium]|nr:4'-phosphopantetheinyl transferase superfamily protein [Clostridia bacterium]
MLKYEFVQIDYNGLSCQKKKRKIEHDLAYSTLNCMLDDIGIEIYEILYNENGKPYLKDEDIHFSISHTDGLVAVCISDSPVGIDCEKINPSYKEKIEHFSKRYFKENEADLIKSSDDMLLEFYKVWTTKEAYIKKHGLNGSYLKKIDTKKEAPDFHFLDNYIITILK